MWNGSKGDEQNEGAERVKWPQPGQVGHVSDTTWTGNPDPFMWLDLDPSVNMSIGGQANGYPIGYQPSEFIFGPPPDQ